MAQFIISAFADEASASLEGQIAALKRNGLCLIEPRSINGNMVDKTDEELTEIANELKKNGILVSSLGSPIGKYPIDEPIEAHMKTFERALAACKILGTDRMRIFSFYVTPDRLAECRDEVMRRMRMMLDRAKEEGISPFSAFCRSPTIRFREKTERGCFQDSSFFPSAPRKESSRRTEKRRIHASFADGDIPFPIQYRPYSPQRKW